jgi:hypothetical protein
MREMSASAQQTSTFTVPAGVTVSDPVPDAANAATAARTAEAEAAVVATPAQPPPAVVPPVAGVQVTWGYAIAGMVVLVASTVLACVIPRFHIKSNIGEGLLVLLCVFALTAGAALVAACFVRNVLRKL